MSWALVLKNTDGKELDRFRLTAHRRSILVHNGSKLAVIDGISRPEHGSTLACFVAGPWGTKLEAIEDDLSVLPSPPKVNLLLDPSTESYKLKKSTSGSTESMLLRANDRIYTTKTSQSLTLAWTTVEVQVNSSATGDQAKNGANLSTGDIPVGIPDSSKDEETEDENSAGDDTAIAATQSNVFARSTPLPSVSRSILVQETPTTDRVAQMVHESSTVLDEAETPVVPVPPVDETVDDRPAGGEKELDGTKAIQGIPKGSDCLQENNMGDGMTDKIEDEPVTTTPARRKSGRHPTVEASTSTRKRSSPMVEDETDLTTKANPSNRSSKRRKAPIEEDEDIGGGIDTMQKNTTKSTQVVTTKRRRQTMDEEEPSEPTPARSLRSSQEVLPDIAVYVGPKPRVLFSNSAIPKNGSVIRFLKRNGGTVVDSVKDEVNILCVKMGSLSKTMKLLQSIALGIPVVTDKWLIDSSKANHFVALKHYKPQIKTQEHEWNFSLERIWGKKQNTLFQGNTVYFTPTLKSAYKNFTEMEEVCRAVGARRVISRPASGKDVDSADTIRMASEEEDEDADKLMRDGHACFTRDLLPNSILRGKLDLDNDEFRIQAPPPVTPAKTPAKKKGRPRKS